MTLRCTTAAANAFYYGWCAVSREKQDLARRKWAYAGALVRAQRSPSWATRSDWLNGTLKPADVTLEQAFIMRDARDAFIADVKARQKADRGAYARAVEKVRSCMDTINVGSVGFVDGLGAQDVKKIVVETCRLFGGRFKTKRVGKRVQIAREL